jgi:hypothetical protein
MNKKNISLIWSKKSPLSISIYNQIKANKNLYTQIETSEYEQNPDDWDEILPVDAYIPSVVVILTEEEKKRTGRGYVCYGGNECTSFLNEYISLNIKNSIPSSPSQSKKIETPINYVDYKSRGEDNTDGKGKFQEHFELLSKEQVKKIPKFLVENYKSLSLNYKNRINGIKYTEPKKMSEEIAKDFSKKNNIYISKPEVETTNSSIEKK